MWNVKCEMWNVKCEMAFKPFKNVQGFIRDSDIETLLSQHSS